MTRRTALATAGALTIVLLAGAAVATNLGLLRMTGDTGQVGRLSPADLVTAVDVQQSAPAGGTAPAGEAASSGGGAGSSGDTEGKEPGERERFGDRLGRDDGSGLQGGGLPRERFQGRQDDD
jgi:hypothetical protein